MAEATKVYRLDESQLEAVRRKASGTISINSETTPLQAGFSLGVQHVLNVLREGFVASVPTPPRD